jgi:DMSO reductase family type II enzyme chaperone
MAGTGVNETEMGLFMPGVVVDERAAVLTDWEQTDLYRFFARVFAPPSQECFAFLTQPSTVEVLRNLWRHLGCEGEFPEFVWFATHDLYESAYIALFDVGLPQPVVPLFESAHDKRHPAQEIALENTYFYEVLGLKSDPAIGVPDYLITQLEFLAAVSFTQENSSDAATRGSLARAKSEFLERHLLNWVPTAAAKLRKTEAPGFPLLMELLVQFLRREHSGNRHNSSA